MTNLVSGESDKFQRRRWFYAAKLKKFKLKSRIIVWAALIVSAWASQGLAQKKIDPPEHVIWRGHAPEMEPMPRPRSPAIVRSKLKADDLVGSGPMCQAAKYSDPEIRDCDLRKSSLEPLRNLQVGLMQNEGARFAQDLRRDYFSNVRSSLLSQYAAAAWLGRGNPLNEKNNGLLTRSIEAASRKCTGESAAPFSEITHEIERIDPLAELGLKKVPQDHIDRSRNFVLKRMLIAWVEVNRIERFLSDRPISKEEKQSLRNRLRRIRETYPLVAGSNEGYSLRQLAEVYYGQVFNQDSTASHPQIDQILFPDEQNSYSSIVPGTQTRQGNEAMVNLILQNPLHPKVEAEMQSLMASSISKSFDSVGALCELNPCQTMQLDLEATARKLNQLPSGKREIASRAACSCSLMTPTEYVASGKQLLMVGGAIGGLVLCPFTFGIGCYGSAVAGAALALSSAANTYGAIKDHSQIEPLVRTVMSLPGLSEDEKRKILMDDNEITGRVLGGVAGTLIGGVPGPALVKRGTKVLTDPEAFRPIAKATVTGEKLLQSSSKQIDELAKSGATFERASGDKMTYLEGGVKYNWDTVKYASTESSYGELLVIKSLPKPALKGSLNTNALSHPQMADYLKKMDELGLNLVVDTSLREINVGAYYWAKTRVIALRPESTWQTFLHEFQHAQFDAFILPRIKALREAVQVEGKSLRDVLPSKLIAEYGEKEVGRLEKLLRNGNANTGIAETMSTARELDALGWRQFLPGPAQGPRIYGAKHRVDSLEQIKAAGLDLTESQSREVLKGRAVVVLSHGYNYLAGFGGLAAVPYVVVKSAPDVVEIIRDVRMIYNSKTGDVIVQTPDGKIIRTSYEKSAVLTDR
ncbi:MAG: hypothetical protein IPJ84_09505 [Bdellovibrionales bacterium]|nr:hypothetical protein [Bdellovibrionales bacterium]